MLLVMTAPRDAGYVLPRWEDLSEDELGKARSRLTALYSEILFTFSAGLPEQNQSHGHNAVC